MIPTVLGFSGAANIATTVKTKPKANNKSSAPIAILPLLYEASSLGRLTSAVMAVIKMRFWRREKRTLRQ